MRLTSAGHFTVNDLPVCDATWFALCEKMAHPDGLFEISERPVKLPPVPASSLEAVARSLLERPAAAAAASVAAGGEEDEDDEEFEDPMLNLRLLPSAPEWLSRLADVDSLASNRGGKIRELINDVIKVLPKEEVAVKVRAALRMCVRAVWPTAIVQLGLQEALKRFKSNSAGPMKHRVLQTVREYLAGQGIDHSANSSMLVARETFRAMTPGETANCGLALDQCMKKTKRLAQDLKEVDQKLKELSFPTASTFLEAVDAVWSKVGWGRARRFQLWCPPADPAPAAAPEPGVGPRLRRARHGAGDAGGVPHRADAPCPGDCKGRAAARGADAVRGRGRPAQV
jgi:hypothetical protein